MAQRSYDNFDLSVERLGAGYRVRVLRSAVGEANEPFLPPQLAATADAGVSLFQAAFVGEVLTAYRRSLDAAVHRNQGLRVRLLLDDVPELAELPWERLYDPSRGRALAFPRKPPWCAIWRCRSRRGRWRLSRPLPSW